MRGRRNQIRLSSGIVARRSAKSGGAHIEGIAFTVNFGQVLILGVSLVALFMLWSVRRTLKRVEQWIADDRVDLTIWPEMPNDDDDEELQQDALRLRVLRRRRQKELEDMTSGHTE